MHIFLTGGTGFFGKSLLRYWRSLDAGDLSVTVLSRDPARFREQNPSLVDGAAWLTFHRGDVTLAETLPMSGDFTHVIHAATAVYDGPNRDLLEMHTDNVAGTRNVADLAARVGARRLLFTSSGAVYGRSDADTYAVTEDYRGAPDPLDPSSAYALSKIAGEQICALSAVRSGLEFVVARCFAFSGQDLPLDGNFAIGNFVRDALAGGPIVVNGDGTAVRSYLDQRDLAHWLMAILLQAPPGRAYNVGSDRGITIAELASTVARISGCAAGVTIMGEPDPAKSRSRYVPAIERARRELGLDITIELEDSIRHMLKNAA